jgi:hypothetical protein
MRVPDDAACSGGAQLASELLDIAVMWDIGGEDEVSFLV